MPRYEHSQPPPGYGPVPGGYPPDPLISPDFSGWWDRGVAVARRSWRELATLQLIAGVFLLVVQSAAALGQSLATRELSGVSADDPPPLGPFLAMAGLAMVAAIAAFLLSTLVTLAAVRVIVVTATGGQPSVAEALRGAARRLFPMIGWSLLAGLIMVAGLCACVLPALYFYAVFVVLAPVVALERGGVIGRCFRLFHGDLGSSLARIATIAGITIGAGLAVGLVAVVGDAFADPESAPIPALVVAAVVTSAFGVVVTGALRILTDPLTVGAYADMRARVEPLSSAVLAQELAAAR